VLALGAFLLLLSFSSNFAQGPFQGYLPDLVPERQVNVASAVIGTMRLTGVIAGAAIVSIGATTGDFGLPFIVIGVIEAVLAVLTVVLVREGPIARPRHGRSWFKIAAEAWGTDALRERSFLLMTLTRLLFLMGPSVFVNFALYYMRDTLRLSGAELALWLTLGPAVLAIGAVVGTVPSAWLSNRIGRKPVIWLTAVASVAGIVLIARAQTPIEALPGVALLGFGSGGYLAVDWALMTSTIPRIASGRYMGLANIANSIAGPFAVVLGGRVLDEVTRTGGLEAAPRAAILLGLAFIAAGSLLLIPVKPRVEPPGEVQMAAEAGA
jgi:MFS family permease